MVTKVICGNPVGGTSEIAPAIEICSDTDMARHLDKLESATETHAYCIMQMYGGISLLLIIIQFRQSLKVLLTV